MQYFAQRSDSKCIKHCFQEQNTKKVSLVHTNRIDATIKWYKTVLSRTKVLKSKSNTYKQNQCNYKMIQNTATKSKTIKK